MTIRRCPRSAGRVAEDRVGQADRLRASLAAPGVGHPLAGPAGRADHMTPALRPSRSRPSN